MSSYQALRSDAAFFDLSARGRIRATGEDRARLLHAMSTNDVNRLEAGRGLYAFFLTANGRILADANIYNFGESLWLDTEPEAAEKLFAHLDKYIIADDVVLENEGESWTTIGIEGPRSLNLCEALAIGSLSQDFDVKPWEDGFAVAVSGTGMVGVRLFVPASRKGHLLDRLAALQIPEATLGDMKIVRLENGFPRYGEDISERYLVQETQLLRAVSFTKGCYLGQEIVERVRSRGQVHRLLTPVRLRTQEVPDPGTKLRLGDKDAGEITSAAFSPALDEVVALAYLRSESSARGTTFTAGGTGEAYVP